MTSTPALPPVARRRPKFTFRLAFGIATAAGITISVLLFHASGAPPSRTTAIMKFCLSKNFTNAVPVLADALGYFKSEGIDARISVTALGKDCAELLKNGAVDLGIAYDTPIVHQLAEGQQWRVLTELHSSTRNTGILYSRKSGIHVAADLLGKRVAMIPGTNGEFLLDLYCMAQDFDCKQIKRVPISMADLKDLFPSGRADAVVIWEPMASELIRQSDGDLGTLRATFYTEFSLLAAKSDYVDAHSAEITRFVAALARAQNYFNEHPKDAKDLALRRLGYNEREVPSVNWNKIHLSLGLSSVLKSMMEHELEALLSDDREAVIDVSGAIDALFEPKFLRTASASLVTYE